jgi:hypothetical protein
MDCDRREHHLGLVTMPRVSHGSVGSKNPGGGIAVLYDMRATRVHLVDHNDEGALHLRVMHTGTAPFTLLPYYLPTVQSHRASAFNSVVDWIAARATKARLEGTGPVIAGGDSNVCVGTGAPLWHRRTRYGPGQGPRPPGEALHQGHGGRGSHHPARLGGACGPAHKLLRRNRGEKAEVPISVPAGLRADRARPSPLLRRR